MRKSERAAFTDWAIAYAANPNTTPSSTQGQALAIKIHALMSDGKWQTTAAIAASLNEDKYLVISAMLCIRAAWGYEASKSRTKGYRRKL
jgi:hypothetical protein